MAALTSKSSANASNFHKRGGEPKVRFLPDQSPQPNYITLKLNSVDVIKVFIPDGALAGRVQLAGREDLLQTRQAKRRAKWEWARSIPLLGRLSRGARRASEQDGDEEEVKGSDDDDASEREMDQNGRTLYHLQQVQTLARTGSQKANCLFTGPTEPAGRFGREWVRLYFREEYISESIDAWVSDVYCVIDARNRFKVLIDPPPPVPLSSFTSPPSTLEILQEYGNEVVPAVEMFVTRYYPLRGPRITYALTKIASDQGSDGNAVDVNDLVLVKRAAVFYNLHVQGFMVCRPIVYDGWPGRPLYQGPGFQCKRDLMLKPSQEAGILVHSIYCEREESYGDYMRNTYQTNWDPKWRSSAG